MTRRTWLYAGVLALSIAAWGGAFVLGATREVDPISPAEFVWAVSFLPLRLRRCGLDHAGPHHGVGLGTGVDA